MAERVVEEWHNFTVQRGMGRHNLDGKLMNRQGGMRRHTQAKAIALGSCL